MKQPRLFTIDDFVSTGIVPGQEESGTIDVQYTVKDGNRYKLALSVMVSPHGRIKISHTIPLDKQRDEKLFRDIAFSALRHVERVKAVLDAFDPLDSAPVAIN